MRDRSATTSKRMCLCSTPVPVRRSKAPAPTQRARVSASTRNDHSAAGVVNDGLRDTDLEAARRLVDRPRAAGALVAHGHSLGPPARDVVGRVEVAGDLGVGPTRGVPGVQQAEPVVPVTAGALADALVGHAGVGDPRRQGGEDERGRLLVVGRVDLVGDGGNVPIGGRIPLAGLLHAGSDGPLAGLVGGHRA